MVDVIGGAEHLGLVDEVDTQLAENLRLHEVADAGLRHHRDGHGVDDALDEIRIGHAGHAALGADIGRHALQRHDGGSARVFSNSCLLRGNDVHDDAALEHVS